MNLQSDLKDGYLRDYSAEAAALIERLPDRDLHDELADVSADALAHSLDLLSSSRSATVFGSLDAERQVEVLQLAPSRLATKLLTTMDESARLALLERLPAPLARELIRLQRYDEDSAGRLLDRPYDSVRTDMTVAEALELLQRSGARKLRSIYVVDQRNKLVGKVDMQSIAMADPQDRLGELIEGLEGSVLATSPRSEVVEQLEKHRVDSLPVVDVEGRLLGIVRYQRLFEAIETEAIAGLQTMVGVSPEERALSSASFSVKRRLPWLHINLLTAFLAAAVVGVFESLIAQVTALAVLLPVVAGQSGNAGSQALAVTMRGLALREIGLRDWRLVLTKEVRVGIMDGLALALTCGLAVFIWSQSFGLALVIGVAMVLSMIAAGISGALVPMLLIRFGQDPATASSIILTTVTDVSGFVSFLGTASLLSFML